jgi:uncharacterized protein YbjQ (UPF0145 family)
VKRFSPYIIIPLLIYVSSVADARDTIVRVSVEEAMTTDDAKVTLGVGIRFFFADQSHPEVESRIGSYTANKKTNAFNKSDQEACKWAFLSAMASLQKRALAEGGNAVVSIRSFYKKREFTSATEFECGAGAMVAGVTLVGDVVKLAE